MPSPKMKLKESSAKSKAPEEDNGLENVDPGLRVDLDVIDNDMVDVASKTSLLRSVMDSQKRAVKDHFQVVF